MHIRPTERRDIPALQRLVDATELFPSDMLEGMLSGFLTESGDGSLWLSCENAGEIVGFCYAAPEEMTDGAWNMLAIGVSPAAQRQGVGGAIVADLETRLRRDGRRLLIVDTSGKPEFDRARAFYRKSGYVEEARIRDFWADGDDKVVFWKRLKP